jgi:hypothetical protein
MALFGEGSFIASRSANPSAYKENDTPSSRSASACVDLVPLGQFLADDPYSDTYSCVKTVDGSGSGLFGVSEEIRRYLENFQIGKKNLQNAFVAASFLANQAWMESLNPLCNNLVIPYDNGLDTQVPVISMAGLVLISILLGLHLLILMVLGTWSAMTSRWTASLDSFTMMSIGGTIADSIPLKIAQNRDTIEVLDKLPGWIGDETNDSESAGRIGLGAPKRIDEDRRYVCYEGDHEPTNVRDEVVNIRKRRAELRA